MRWWCPINSVGVRTTSCQLSQCQGIPKILSRSERCYGRTCNFSDGRSPFSGHSFFSWKESEGVFLKKMFRVSSMANPLGPEKIGWCRIWELRVVTWGVISFFGGIYINYWWNCSKLVSYLLIEQPVAWVAFARQTIPNLLLDVWMPIPIWSRVLCPTSSMSSTWTGMERYLWKSCHPSWKQMAPCPLFFLKGKPLKNSWKTLGWHSRGEPHHLHQCLLFATWATHLYL